MAFISSLKLHNLRSYHSAALSDLPGGFVVLYGPNGAGKTNLLEAVSLLAPGRGLRGAKVSEMQNQAGGEPWAISASLQTEPGEIKPGTGLDPASPSKRLIRIQGVPARSQSALAEHIACVWLTPQMDGLFLGSAQERRRFFDRLIFAFDPAHSGRLTRYENALRQRSKLLQDGTGEPSWLDSLESQMAETGISIAAARLDFAQRLQSAAPGGTEPFPRARLALTGTIENLLSNQPALEIERLFQYQLAESRGVDMQTGGAATGPHKSDLAVSYDTKDMPAAHCSTGEQKALLIGLILAHAQLIKAERGAPPVLLLDEIAAHLDESRRRALYEILQQTGGQIWLTGTDRSLFEELENSGMFYQISHAQIHPEA